MSLVTRPLCAELIDFEQLPGNTTLTNQYEAYGLRISGVGALSGFLITEGTFGSANFGNSSNRIVHIGERDEPTTLTFTDPANPARAMGVTEISFLVGDGNPDLEDVEVTYRDFQGAVLAATTYATSTSGVLVSTSARDLGSLIWSVELRLVTASASGAAFDDLSFRLASQDYEFINVRDSTTAFVHGGFCKLPAINDAGLVAYIANQSLSVNGIFVSNGTTETPIDLGGNDQYSPGADRCFGPDINSAGSVAFWRANYAPAPSDGIYRSSGGVITPIAEASSPYLYVQHDSLGWLVPSLMESGEVGFFASTTPPINIFPMGAYLGDGSSTTTIHDSSEPTFLQFGRGRYLQVNDDGDAAFWGETPDGWALFRSSGGIPTMLFNTANNTVECQHDFFNSINNQNEVLVSYSPWSTGCDPSAIRLELRKAVTERRPVYDAATSPLDRPIMGALNAVGGIAVIANRDGGGRGIYSGVPLDTTIIETGDTLFGSPVTYLMLGPNGLNNRGEIAFSYMLADGRDGYAKTGTITTCSNGVDDDGDGLVDGADPGCEATSDTSERALDIACDDSFDNDGDGFADYPIDPECLSASGVSEVPEPGLVLSLPVGVLMLSRFGRRGRGSSQLRR